MPKTRLFIRKHAIALHSVAGKSEKHDAGNFLVLTTSPQTQSHIELHEEDEEDVGREV